MSSHVSSLTWFWADQKQLEASSQGRGSPLTRHPHLNKVTLHKMEQLVYPEAEEGCAVKGDCHGKISKEGVGAGMLQLRHCAGVGHSVQADAVVWADERLHYFETRLTHFKRLQLHTEELWDGQLLH